MKRTLQGKLKEESEDVVCIGEKNYRSLIEKLQTKVHAEMFTIVNHYLSQDIVPALQARIDKEDFFAFVMNNKIDESSRKRKLKLTDVIRKPVSRMKEMIFEDFNARKVLTMSTGRRTVPLIITALKRGQLKVVEWLAHHGGTEIKDSEKDNNCYYCFSVIFDYVYSIGAIDLLIRLGFDPNHRCRHGRSAVNKLLERHLADSQHRICLRYLVRCGAGVDTDFKESYHDSFSQRKLIRELRYERLFVNVVVGGILSRGKFREFLADGVCDARLLIHVASFE